MSKIAMDQNAFITFREFLAGQWVNYLAADPVGARFNRGAGGIAPNRKTQC